uniref:hypothetical protein n=1 Tax=Enterocloster clostridioformis TaxID=1531 RepID=UPI0026CCB56F
MVACFPKPVKSPFHPGVYGLMLTNLLNDVMLGEPEIIPAPVGLGVIDPDFINIMITGHQHFIFVHLQEQLRKPQVQELAKAAGARGQGSDNRFRKAAKNMYGIPTPYEDTYALKNTMNFFGLPALCTGDINCLDSRTLVITEEDSKNYKKALVEDGVLKSILMAGNISGSGIYQYLIKNQIKLPSAGRSIFRLSFADFYGFDTSKGSYTWDTDLCRG